MGDELHEPTRAKSAAQLRRRKRFKNPQLLHSYAGVIVSFFPFWEREREKENARVREKERARASCIYIISNDFTENIINRRTTERRFRQSSPFFLPLSCPLHRRKHTKYFCPHNKTQTWVTRYESLSLSLFLSFWWWWWWCAKRRRAIKSSLPDLFLCLSVSVSLFL